LKSQHLLQSLLKEDLLILEKSLVDQKKTKLLSVFQWLKDNEDYDKQSLFSFVYGEEYQANKDYLLRNDIRNLNNFLKEYIVKKEILKPENDWIQRKLLLQYYINTKQKKLFEEEWEEAFKKLDKETEHLAYFELIQLKKNAIVEFQEVTEANFSSYIKLLENSIPNIDNLSMDVQFELLFNYEFASRVLYSITNNKREKKNFEVKYGNDFNNLAKSTQIKYYKAKQYDVHLAFEEKEQIFTKLLTLLEGQASEQILIYNNFGVEYFIRSDFENARHYYYMAFELIREHNFPVDSRLLYTLQNLISASVAIEKFEEAIEIFTVYQDKFINTPKTIETVSWIIALAYLFRGKTKEATELMNYNFKEKGQIAYYFRAVCTLGYIINKEFDLAEREAENCYRALKATPLEHGEFEKLFLALKHLIDYKNGKIQKKEQILNYLNQENNIGFHVKKLITSLL
jgi:hypothetical protein